MVKDFTPGSQHQPPTTSTSSLASSSTSISFTLDVITSIRCITSLLVIVATLPNEITIAAGNSNAVKQWHSTTTFPMASTTQCGTPSPPSAAPTLKKPQP